MFFIWLAFLNKDDLKTIKLLFISCFFWWIMHLLLETYAGLVASIISALRLYLSMKYKKNIKIFLIMIVIIIVSWYFVYDSYYSFLPILASLIWAYSFFFFSGIILRIWCLIMSIIWLIYSIHIWTLWGIMNEVVVQILIIVAIYKYIWINWYKIHFSSKILSVFYPYENLDYWHYWIIKDKDIIYTRYDLIKKIKIFIIYIMSKIKDFIKKYILKY
jgi:hypothetical protein